MTLDRLAQIIETTVAKKEDIVALATKEGLALLDQKIDAVEYTIKEGFRFVRDEIKGLLWLFSKSVHCYRKKTRDCGTISRRVQ